ncbi:hypothetical protein Pan44_04360 [Caulifigura coniformis]|uniref:Uncharacterized protein n=1 Tax=Caulifigura coniformis TaxID=2527983 RepID=A0A517S8H1_9PLAN|nr:hypothetical protein [Caulifigura coniformis]QDT52425.1 hypothetical protein Pan44_04360 [Caulifigura coniformis]
MHRNLIHRAVSRPGAWMALLCVFGAGCGESWEADTYPAHGELFINGKPAAGAFVTLIPAGEKVDIRESKPWGFVQDDGSYSIRTYEAGDGAPAGEYKLTIVWRFDPRGQAETDRLGFVYSRPEKSQWAVTIEPGENELPRIELDNVKILEEPRRKKAASPSPFDATEERGSGAAR